MKLPERPKESTSAKPTARTEPGRDCFSRDHEAVKSVASALRQMTVHCLSRCNIPPRKKAPTSPTHQHDGRTSIQRCHLGQPLSPSDTQVESRSALTKATTCRLTSVQRPQPALPKPRSSHDAAILGDTQYIAGRMEHAWSRKDRVWHTTGLTLDRSKYDPQWKTIDDPPFQSRAFSLALWNEKTHCIGVMKMECGPTTLVEINQQSRKAAAALCRSSMSCHLRHPQTQFNINSEKMVDDSTAGIDLWRRL